MGYSLFVAIFAFAAAAQLSARFNTKPMTSTIVAVMVPFAVDLFTKWIMHHALWVPVNIAIVVVQFIVALVIFRALQYGNSFSSWIFWTIFGMFLIVFAIPQVVNNIFSFI